MNTKNLKAYAPKARTQFIEAVKKRAAHFGIYEDRIEEVRIEGGAAIIEGRAFTRKEGEQRKRLENKVAERGYEMFIREMAYTWFNRLAALRYMEIHDYFDHGFRVLSHPSNPESLPEILNHASDVADSLDLDKSYIVELQLAGDKEEELYRELLLGQCHHLSKIMPFMFEAIDDATELLLPNNLTKTDSILKGLTNEIPEEDWQEIEVIGWLYQFYISEHKEAVIGKVVKSEDIPAATQLFTPNWIVKYLVQNSVGRQWIATYPDSELKGKMDYYIEPAEQSEEIIEQLKSITPTSIDPEEIKVLDPACGSGHILVEVYEVLRGIYLERGYRLREIPELILTKNIYGLDIDERAAQLAGFALMMKAREDDRRIFQRVEEGELSLNVFSLQSTEHLDIPKLWKALDLEGNQQTGSTVSLFEEPVYVNPTNAGIYGEYYELIQTLKSTFLQAKTLGSLIQIEHSQLNKLVNLKKNIDNKAQCSDPVSKQAALEILPIVKQAIALAQRYDSVIANPPYMGAKGMNSDLKEFAKRQFPNSKSDLFAIFIERGFDWVKDGGFNSQVTMQSWMFLSSYEKLREEILRKYSIQNMLHMGNGVMKIAFGTNATVFKKLSVPSYCGHFSYCESGDIDNSGTPYEFPIKNERLTTAASSDFKKIPGYPIAYWLSDAIFNCFENSALAEDYFYSDGVTKTGNNEKYLFYFWEVDLSFALNKELYRFATKGGDYQKFYGNDYWVLRWSESVREHYRKDNVARITPEYLWDKEGITWTDISASLPSFRYFESSFIAETKGPVIFPKNEDISYLFALLGVLNSNFGANIIKLLNPTVSTKVNDLLRVPMPHPEAIRVISGITKELVQKYKQLWFESENTRGFKFPASVLSTKPIQRAFQELADEKREIFEQISYLETKLENCVLSSFCLNASDLSPLIKFRQFNEHEYKLTFLNSFISYVLGCLMGRYSHDREGIVYANSQNNGFKELEASGAFETFPADDDGIIPLASEEWLFDDDATTRFKEFVKTVWGDEHLSENLKFIAESLCLHTLKPKKGESAMDTIRRYFSTHFFKDHCKTYKKRPIYWLFSSGKEKAFECLVYLHRYNEGTLSRMRTEYVTPLMGKYDAQHTLLSEQQLQATGTEARRIEKELKSLEKKQAELRTFDEQLKHYAEMRITLDLDDGVKANYGKFGNLLADVKAIHGKAVK